jgi:hypothetical protein
LITNFEMTNVTSGFLSNLKGYNWEVLI